MKKFIAIVFLVTLQFGCARYTKTAFVNGHLNVVFRSHEAAYEQDAWNFVVKTYKPDRSKIKRPEALSEKRDFVQKAYEILETNHREREAVLNNAPVDRTTPVKQVVGFYNPASNLVVYTIGEFGTLVHEYCHSLNHQLGLRLTPDQDEYFCQQVEEDYEGRQEMQRLRQQNRELKRELNSRGHR